VITRSLQSMCCDTAFNNVVLPEPVPPEINMLRRERVAISKSRDTSADKFCCRTIMSSVRLCFGNLRIEIDPPFSTSGGKTILTRLPSASLASTIGLASSMRRPIAVAIRCAMLARCCASRKRAAVFSSLPFRST
jgi:hypothetical protein